MYIVYFVNNISLLESFTLIHVCDNSEYALVKWKLLREALYSKYVGAPAGNKTDLFSGHSGRNGSRFRNVHGTCEFCIYRTKTYHQQDIESLSKALPNRRGFSTLLDFRVIPCFAIWNFIRRALRVPSAE